MLDPLQLLCIFEYQQRTTDIWYPVTRDAKWAVWCKVSGYARTLFKSTITSKSLQCLCWYFPGRYSNGANRFAELHKSTRSSLVVWACGVLFLSSSRRVSKHPQIRSTIPQYFWIHLHLWTNIFSNEICQITSAITNDWWTFKSSSSNNDIAARSRHTNACFWNTATQVKPTANVRPAPTRLELFYCGPAEKNCGHPWSRP